MCQRRQNSRERSRQVRLAEVVRQLEAEQMRDADRDVGVAREVAVDLDRERERAEQQRPRRRARLGSCEHASRRHGARRSAMAIFLNSPSEDQRESRRASWSSVDCAASRRAAAGSRAARTIGPATSCGKKGTKSDVVEEAPDRPAARRGRRRSCRSASGTCRTRCRPGRTMSQHGRDRGDAERGHPGPASSAAGTRRT